MTEKKMIYIGGSGRGATKTVKHQIVKQAKMLCRWLDEMGYGYYIDSSLLDESINISNPKTKIPKEFYSDIPDSLINKISGLRDESETLIEDVAMLRWLNKTMSESYCCIWLHARSQTGLGFEVFKALFEHQLYCLVLYSTKSISSLLKGQTSRLFQTRRWEDKTAKSKLEKFLKAVDQHYDKPVRILLNDHLYRVSERRAQELGYKGQAEYLRELIRADINGG